MKIAVPKEYVWIYYLYSMLFLLILEQKKGRIKKELLVNKQGSNKRIYVIWENKWKKMSFKFFFYPEPSCHHDQRGFVIFQKIKVPVFQLLIDI